MAQDGVLDTCEDSDETTKWLNENGLSCIIEKCLQNDMTLEVLMEADLSDIKAMCNEANIKIQNRLKLQSALKKTPQSTISQQQQKPLSSVVEQEGNNEEKVQQHVSHEIDAHNFIYFDENAPQRDHLFKITLIGDPCVGKSSILLRFTDDTFIASWIKTIGVDWKLRTLKVDDKIVTLQLWDTAGQERFRTIQSAYYRSAHAIVMVYDITNKQSFDNAADVWTREIEKYASDEIIVFMVGTKIDLENQRVVTCDEGNSFAKSKGYKFCEVSAKSGKNIRQLFNTVALYCLAKYPVRKVKEGVVDLHAKWDKKNKKKCC